MQNAVFDIFKKAPDGKPVWMDAVPDISTAERRVAELKAREPGEYFVFSQQTHQIVRNSPVSD